MAGVALAAGELALAYQGAERFVLDVILIVVWGMLVVALKAGVRPPPQADGVAVERPAPNPRRDG